MNRPTSVASSGSDVVVFFGDSGSFTFNPLANWPIVVLQGNAVLGTYGVIIVWALILGAIVWGISILGQYSGFFSGIHICLIYDKLAEKRIRNSYVLNISCLGFTFLVIFFTFDVKDVN